MEMQHVERVGVAAHIVEHQQMVRQGILYLCQSQRFRTTGDQPRRRLGIAACEQGDIVALGDELLGEVGDDSFGTAVQPRRHAFHERRDLCDPHR
jgi:hypothetical protein